MVILDKLAPQSLLRQFLGCRAGVCHLLLGHCRKLSHGVLDGVSHLRVVVVGAMDYLHTVFQFAFVANLGVDPLTESCKVGSDTWHLECYGLKRGISPR